MGTDHYLDRPGVRIVFSLPEGPALTRWWTWREVFDGHAPDWLFLGDPPWWLAGKGTEDPPGIRWADPLLPIEFHGRVIAAYVPIAREWVIAAGGHVDDP